MRYIPLLLISFLTSITGCTQQSQQPSLENALYSVGSLVKVQNPDWVKDATIYQINVRQFTQEGTLKAAREELPRLKALGVKILWLMPIHPIGEVNRKGPLGSPYSIKDYFAVNPEFGTLDDMKLFVQEAHDMGLYVILDWVANHTSWDNSIRIDHPEWYEQDANGNVAPTPWFDWADIIDLDYSNTKLRRYMGKAMRFWVEDVGIDGYRCDAAGLVPLSFWQDVRKELEKVKPVFMLAEWEGRDFHYQAFDATYAWSWWRAMHSIAKGHGGLGKLYEFYSWNTGYYPDEAIRLNYVSNHDSNSWEATQFEAFGEALETTIVLSVIGPGIPMIYNGQEAGNPKRLKFFERDPIHWQPHPIGELYTQLFHLKRKHSALWNGKWGAPMRQILNNNSNHVLSFARTNAQETLIGVFNLSPEPQTVTLTSDWVAGIYMNALTQEQFVLGVEQVLDLGAWEYLVLVSE